MAITPTPTMTPSTTPIICGSGVTTGTHYYTDCCGNFVQGKDVGTTITLDYTKRYLGVLTLNVATIVSCPTPTSTQTPSPTPTLTITSTVTPTNTPTSTLTPTPTQTPTNSPAVRLKNDCEVFTSFPLGVECYAIQQPTSRDSLNGILSLKVTGGTTPYSYWWANGQRSQTLVGIGAGNYEVIVIDYYGDYSATTICSLFAPSPTPTSTTTPTPTLTPSAPCPTLCMIIITPQQTFGPWQFSCNGSFNNRTRWTYSVLSYSIVWDNSRNRWRLVQSDMTTPVPFDGGATIASSTSNQSVPDSGWSFFGGTLQGNISVTRGNCPSYIPLQASVEVQSTNCGNSNCNGSVIITASNGQPPYQFSINNGLTFQTSNIFNGLCPNTYSIITKDADNNTFIGSAVVTSDGQLVTYNVYTSVTNVITGGAGNIIGYWNALSNITIPLGTNIQGTLVITSTRTYNEPGTGVINTSNNVYQNGNLVTPFNTTSTTVEEQRPFCATNRTIVTDVSTYNVQISNGDSLGQLSGYTNSSMQITDSQNQSGCATLLQQTISVVLTNVTLKGCVCCEVVVNPTPATFNNELASGQLGGGGGGGGEIL